MSDEKSAAESDDVWEDDLLDRKPHAEYIYNFLLSEIEQRRRRGKNGSFVLNLDAEWGGGKSFFMRRFAEDLRQRGHLVAEIDAWRDDHAEDPYLAIISALNDVISPLIETGSSLQRSWDAVKQNGGRILLRTGAGVIKTAIKKYAGESVDELIDAVKDEDSSAAIDVVTTEASKEIAPLLDTATDHLVQQFQRTSKSMNSFEENLAKVANALEEKGVASPLFVLIDELDRCRPNYAIKLLERVKHLFEVDGIVFVFSTNTDQLQHAVSGVYGSSFDGFNYLQRFFDRTYRFPSPSPTELVKARLHEFPVERLITPDDDLVSLFTIGFAAFDLDLRSFERVIDVFTSAANAWRDKKKISSIILFQLSVDIVKNGKTEFRQLTQDEISKWNIQKQRVHNYEGEFDPSISYGNIHNQAIIYIQNIRGAQQMTGNTMSAIIVRQIYEQETAAIRATAPNESIQYKLSALVQFAGQMLPEEPETKTA